MTRFRLRSGCALALCAALAAGTGSAVADAAGTETAEGLRLAAHDPLQARQTYQIVQQRQGDRWLLYLGHLRGSEFNPLTGRVEENGTSVVDVTDPHNPRVVSQVVRTQPARDGKLRTHKNFWDCATGEAYLVTSVAGWTGQILQVFDLADPAKPRHIRDFGLPGTQPGGATARADGFSLHEATVLGDRVYLAYGVNHDGVIQILDREKLLRGDAAVADPLFPSEASLRYPEIARMDMPHYWGGHSAKPILDVPVADYARNKTGARRNFLFVTSEGIDFRCQTPRHISFFVDMTDERHPWPVSNFQVPALPRQPGDPDFCERGVFGPHSPHASHNPLYEGKLLFLAYFTGGVRVIDMRDPFAPVEVGHYIAAQTANSRVIYPPDAGPDVKAWPVANTVEIDERGGFIFMADRPHNGLYILELTGRVQELAAPPALPAPPARERSRE